MHWLNKKNEKKKEERSVYKEIFKAHFIIWQTKQWMQM